MPSRLDFALQFESQAVVDPSLVVKQIGTTAIRGDQKIEYAIIVDVTIGCASRHFGAAKTSPS